MTEKNLSNGTPQKRHKPPSQYDIFTIRKALRGASSVALSCLDRHTAMPYASLVMMATDQQGAPLFLLSDLAEHCKNIKKNPRISVLIDPRSEANPMGASPLSALRLTLQGDITPIEASPSLKRYLTRHPDATQYAQFADFHLYRLQATAIHKIEGFGQIDWVKCAGLWPDIAQIGKLEKMIPEIIRHMNSDHLDALVIMASHFLKLDGIGCQMVDMDCDGFYLRHADKVYFIAFFEPAITAQLVRKQFMALTNHARMAMTQSYP